MYKITEAFLRALNFRHIHYRLLEQQMGNEGVLVSIAAEPILNVYFFFNEEKSQLTVQVFNLVEGRSNPQLMELLNQLNEEYSFVKFYYDSDSAAVHARIQMLVTEDTAAMIGIRMQGIMVGACTDVYRSLFEAVK